MVNVKLGINKFIALYILYLYQKVEAQHHGLPTPLEVHHGIYVSMIENSFSKAYSSLLHNSVLVE